jgi:hypothetical protein
MVKPNVDFMQNYRPTPNRVFDLYNYYQGLGPTTGTPTTTTASVPGYKSFFPGGGDGGGGGGITSIDPSGFKQTNNLFQAAPFDYEYDAAFPNAGRTKSMLGKARDFGIKALSSSLLSQGGAQLGFGLLGPLGALGGAIGGGILGFGARGPTEAERVVGNFYGNQGNSPMQYLDEDGILQDSVMQGYNISSAFGKGIPAAIDKRLARIARTAKKKGLSDNLKKLQDKLIAEKKALAAAELKQLQNKAKQMGYQGNTRSDDAQSFADTQTYGGGGTMNDQGADTFT